MTDTRWETVGEAHDGIEFFLLEGPKGMSEIAKHAADHGVGLPEAVGIVTRLVIAGRIVAVVISHSPRIARAEFIDSWNGMPKSCALDFWVVADFWQAGDNV